jgi:RimJ/RimL family protein N-acetyltransferase
MEWPFPDLRIVCGEVVLRGVTDADLDPLLAVLPDDLEQDPRHRPFLEPAADRRRILSAEIWQHRGTWSPASWCLDLAVEVEGRVVGVQALEGEEFPQLRTVDSYSWLATEVRGRGLATAMRTGVLALAFDHLGAVAAVSSAEVGNAPSLAVSRRLGYADNGVSRTVSPSGVITLQHVRLTAETWRAAGHSVVVEGVEVCLPWFGTGPAVS